MLLRRGFGGADQGDRTVVDAGSVTRSHGAVGLHHGLQFGERLDGRVWTRMLISVKLLGIALLLRDHHRYDLRAKETSRMRLRPALLRAIRESVLIGAIDVKFLGHIFGGFGHG